ncbi:MAG: sugar phosphate isomerase/epimerase [Desulfuromonadales bacterium]|nr:sugar phosphate isomerase/epimerase [Desulfuromonadales bacterium]
MGKRIFAHLPFLMAEDFKKYVVVNRIFPEVFLSGDVLDRVSSEQIRGFAEFLSNNQISCTIHAPFMDLNPGSSERLLREATRHRFKQICEVATILKPVVMVMHPGYDRWRYGSMQDYWLEKSTEVFKEVLAVTEETNCKIAVENIFEDEPSTLLRLITAINHPRLGHCFDVGHWNLFHKEGSSLEEWFEVLGYHIFEVHIHDNHGESDEHLPVGEGEIDFKLYFRLLAEYAPDAEWTLEAHSVADIERAIKNIQQYSFD